MYVANYFQVNGDHAVFRPSGETSFEDAAAMVAEAIVLARAQNLKRLLADTSAWTGFRPPSITARFFAVKKWASAAGGRVRVAVVARPEMIDPHKFGVTVARNSGLMGDVFASESEALAWLLEDN